MIAAAGSGQRLGAGGPKALVELAGRPLLDHSLRALERCGSIAELVLAAPESHLQDARDLLGRRPGLSGTVLAGGATRAESVRLALAAVRTELVVVHDAARPLAPPALFDAIVSRLRGDPDAAAAIAAAPILDTVKRSRAPHGSQAWGEVEETVPREMLWAAQTPQGFRTDALRAAQQLGADRGELERATDEARLIELAGGRVLLEPGPGFNLKVTTADDLTLAGALLGAAAGV